MANLDGFVFWIPEKEYLERASIPTVVSVKNENCKGNNGITKMSDENDIPDFFACSFFQDSSENHHSRENGGQSQTK